MREIKFRAKNVMNGEWVCGDLVHYNHSHTHISIAEKECKQQFFVHPQTIGQFTGLRDKNGKEIYEGDIVRFNQKFLIENILLVGYEYSHRGGFSLCTKEGYYGMFGDAWLEPFYCEVIGNIHDNPEMMEANQ